MKFKQYLIEKEMISFRDLLLLLNDNCQPYINEYKSSIGKTTPLFFLSGRYNTDPYFIRNVRKDRMPKDMPYKIHNELDDRFYQEYGIRARSNSIFVTGAYNDAKSYGDVVKHGHIGNKYQYGDKVNKQYNKIANNKGYEEADKWISKITFKPYTIKTDEEAKQHALRYAKDVS